MDGIKKKKSASKLWKKKVKESKLGLLTSKSSKKFRSSSITNLEMSPKKNLNVQLQNYSTTAFSDINDLSMQHMEDDFKATSEVPDVNDSKSDDSLQELFKTLADNIEQKFKKNQDKITNLKKKVIDLLNQVSTLEEQKSYLQKNSANLNLNNDLLKLAMDGVEKKYQEVKNINKVLENNLTQYKDCKKYLETNLEECKARANELKIRLDETVQGQMESKNIIQKQEGIISRLEKKNLCNCSSTNSNNSDEFLDLQTKVRKTNKERLVFFNEKETLKKVNESLKSEILLLKKGHHEVSNYAFEHESPKVSIKTEIKTEPIDDCY